MLKMVRLPLKIGPDEIKQLIATDRLKYSERGDQLAITKAMEKLIGDWVVSKMSMKDFAKHEQRRLKHQRKDR